MTHSEIFADPANDRVRILAKIAEKQRRIRVLHSEMLGDIAELRGEPDKIVARVLVEALRINPKKAFAMLAEATAITEILTPTGHTTPAPLPTVRDAVREGVLDGDHIDAIADTMAELPTRISVADRELIESTLTDLARLHAPVVVRRQGQKILARLDADGQDPGDEREQAEPANSLVYRRSRDGRVKLVAELDAETAEVFEGLILPLSKPKKLNDTTPDPRDKKQRQGDAMSEVIFRAAGHGRTDQAVKTDLIVALDLNMLMDGLSGATLDGGAFLCPSAVRRLACDAGIIPVVCNGKSVPLDLGRTHRLVNENVRNLLIARDRCCAFPGCDQPARMTAAHHIKHWKDGGPTNVDNLVLLCHRHHRVLHSSEWSITMVKGTPYFIPPKWVDRDQKPMRNILRP